MNEFEIIAEFFAPLAKAPGAFGLKDDAAAIRPRPGFDLVVTTDRSPKARISSRTIPPSHGGEKGAAGESVRSGRQGRQAGILSSQPGVARRA